MRRGLIIATLATTLGLSGSAAAAHDIGSRITVHYTFQGQQNVFYGVVKSNDEACTRHRGVKLLSSASGPDSGYNTFATGIVTNRDGTWSYRADNVNNVGYVKAVAQRKQVGDGTCVKTVSRPEFIP